MILVSVGIEEFPFNRLMRWIDTLVIEGFLQPEEEEVIVQYGTCTFLPRSVKSFALLPELEFHNCMDKARFIIAHCGEGILDQLATLDKPYILVPRQRIFGEHVDNHQLELAKELTRLGIPIAYSLTDLFYFLSSPEFVKVATVPSIYYAQACSLLDQELG